MAGVNLHKIVRAAITALHPDETLTYYMSAGHKNVKGKILPIYESAATVDAQFQSEDETTLYHTNNINLNDTVFRAYLYADTWHSPSGILRPFARGGDVFQRENGTWWLVTAVIENFERVNWVCVRCTMQVKPPDFSACEWYEGDSDDGTTAP